jgi:hypothetical protein
MVVHIYSTGIIHDVFPTSSATSFTFQPDSVLCKFIVINLQYRPHFLMAAMVSFYDIWLKVMEPEIWRNGKMEICKIVDIESLRVGEIDI